MNNNELAHYGVLGMRWGVRRYQKKDGSLTPAGKKRYSVDIEGAKRNLKEAKKNQNKAYTEYNKKTLGGMVYNQKATDDYLNSVKKTKWAKDDLKSEKIKTKLNNETKKSARRSKLEEYYRNKGMNEEEAAIAAYKRERTEKILAVSAGLTVAAVGAYVAKNQYDKRVDQILKPGTVLQNISSNSNRGVSDAFYASMNESDNTKYRGVYGNVIKSRGNQVYETKIGVKSNLKIASEKSAVNALSELIENDHNYENMLDEHLVKSLYRYPTQKQSAVIRKGLHNLRKNKIDATVYNALNLSLVDHDLPTSSAVNKVFYDKLKSKGYDAIIDVNDKKFSGYGSKKPVIVFNGAERTAIDSVREVGAEEIKKANAKGMLDIAVKQLAPSVATNAAAVAAVTTGMKALERKQNDKIVQDYRKKHPDTKLSYNEIVRNYGK